jgi:hypothetical protein
MVFIIGLLPAISSIRVLLSQALNRHGASTSPISERAKVGWATGDRLQKDLALMAIRKALIIGCPPEALIHHRDCGSNQIYADCVNFPMLFLYLLLGSGPNKGIPIPI